MTYLGAHLSSAGGFYKMGRAALAIGANTLQCFVRNPRGARAKAVDPEDLGRLRALLAEQNPFEQDASYLKWSRRPQEAAAVGAALTQVEAFLEGL